MNSDLTYKSLVVSTLFPETLHDGEALANKIKQLAKESFYNTVEFYYEGQPQKNEQVRNALQEQKMESVFLAGFPLKSRALDLGAIASDERQEAMDCARRSIDLAYYYGSKKMLVLSGKHRDNEEDNRRTFEHLVASLTELCEYAEQKATDYVLTLTLEYFNNKGEPYLLVGPSAMAAELAKRVKQKCSNFELTFDLSHALQLGEDPQKTLRDILTHVNHIHLANCVTKDSSSPLYGDKHPPFNIEGGDVYTEDLLRFMKEIRQSGVLAHDPIIGVEVITRPEWNADELYRESTRLFKETIAQTV